MGCQLRGGYVTVRGRDSTPGSDTHAGRPGRGAGNGTISLRRPLLRGWPDDCFEAKVMEIHYHSRVVRRESRHAAGLVAPFVEPSASVLDVGCGDGYVAAELAARGASVMLTDIVDLRRIRELPFRLFDGRHLPFDDRQFDVVMLNFVLHHVPNELKAPLLDEAARVSRRRLFILEDTPRNALDRFLNRRHGCHFRAKIGSSAAFGFFTTAEWEWLFRGRGLVVKYARALGRFCRAPWQPFARSAFLLDVPA
jgi:SAM-dependent methyltransferase